VGVITGAWAVAPAALAQSPPRPRVRASSSAWARSTSAARRPGRAERDGSGPSPLSSVRP
jgi:hypothetical protein